MPEFSDPVEIRALMDSQGSNTSLRNVILMARERRLVKWGRDPMKPMYDLLVIPAAP